MYYDQKVSVQEISCVGKIPPEVGVECNVEMVHKMLITGNTAAVQMSRIKKETLLDWDPGSRFRKTKHEPSEPSWGKTDV